MGRKQLHLIAALALLLTLLAAGASGCSGVRPAGDLPTPSGVSEDTTETSVYYSTGRTLLEERKIVGAEDVYGATLKELLRAMPEENPDVAIVQPEATFRSVVVEDGVATVDWDANILDFAAEPKEERLALASILATLGQFDDVKKVQFTVEGKTDGQVNGKDVVAFWGDVSLNNQPWPAIKVSKSNPESSTPSGDATGTPGN